MGISGLKLTPGLNESCEPTEFGQVHMDRHTRTGKTSCVGYLTYATWTPNASLFLRVKGCWHNRVWATKLNQLSLGLPSLTNQA
jgi:hypothetical protein